MKRAHTSRGRAESIPWRPLAVLFIAATLAGISYRGATLIQPGYFAVHLSELGYGAATSVAYLFGIIGQYVGGGAADRYDPRRSYLAFHALSLPALVAMSWLGGLPLLAGAALFTFFSRGMEPIENSLFAQLSPARWRATLYGVKFIGTFGIGALAVFLVRWADGVGGLSYAILSLGAVVALVVVSAAVLATMSIVHPGRAPLLEAALAVPQGIVPPAGGRRTGGPGE
jgi:MFS family permease